MASASEMDTLSDKEKLLQSGYPPSRIIEFPDGTVIVDLKPFWAHRVSDH